MSDTKTSDTLPAAQFLTNTTPNSSKQPPRRRPRVGTGTIVGIALLAVTAVAILRPFGARQEEEVTYLTETVTRATLSETVQADAVVQFTDEAVRTVGAPRAGTVTSQSLVADTAPAPFSVAMDIDGVPIAYLPTDIPLYRDLAEGAEGEDVEALEQALDDAGYDPGEVDEVYDADTVEAVNEFQADIDAEQTGIVHLADVITFPAGMVVVDQSVGVGTALQPGQVVATAADPGDLVVVAAVEGDDIGAVAEGDAVEVRLDGEDEVLEGIITRIPMMATEDGTFAVELTVDGLSEAVGVGRQADVDITTETRTDVPIVPLAALQGSGPTAEVQVLVDGEPQVRTIETGLITSDGVEVIGGVSDGEQVIIGTHDTAEDDDR